MSGNNTENKKKWMESYLNQPVLIICCRYDYRGIVSAVFDWGIILTQAYAISEMGNVNNEHPQDEEAIPSDWGIFYDSIESFGQPPMAFWQLKTGGTENE